MHPFSIQREMRGDKKEDEEEKLSREPCARYKVIMPYTEREREAPTCSPDGRENAQRYN